MLKAIKSTVVSALGGPDAILTQRVHRALLGTGLVNIHPEPEPVLPPKARQAKSVFKGSKLPTEFSINLGVAPCNHSCLFCPQSQKKPKKAAWMDMAILEKVLSEMPETGVGLNISSYSETLAAPNLLPAVRMMKRMRPKLVISMATNGSLMREEVVEGLIDAGLDYYQYSFDAPTKDSYAKLMQADHYDRTMDNLAKVVELRNRKNSTMRVITHVMDFAELKKDNEAFIAEMERRFGGVVHASLRSVANWGGIWGLNEQLAHKGFTPVFQAPQKRYPCSSIFMHFKVQHDGRYAPCVASVPDYIPEEEVHLVPYLGNARDMTWGEAWEKLSEMRRAHLAGEWDNYECCRNCNVWGLWPDFWSETDAAPGERRFDIEQTTYIEAR